MQTWDRGHRPDDLPDFHCPLCGKPGAPLMVGDISVNLTQAFCTSDDCRVLMFNPQAPDGGIGGARIMDLERHQD